jgi:CelD/BcsL family acetyltransferase involved in cellulose biosynthesis
VSGAVFVIDPLADPRWDDLVERHPHASLFHSRGWLEALKRTYEYEPFAVTTTAHGPLSNGLPVCRVGRWRRKRLVSLPFSDHCDPLVSDPADLPVLLESLGQEVNEKRARSLELRPRTEVAHGLPTSRSFHLHTLDLTRPEQAIFDGFSASNAQRAVRRAEREGVRHEAGSSEDLLRHFYRLLRLTRRRHSLPPQPPAWFRNLAACLGERLTVHLASVAGQPVAGIMTLSFRKTLVYKYGGSDAAFHRLGVMPFLFWRAIQQAKSEGLEELDLGRSDLDQPGLAAFKDHLGAVRSTLTYYRFPAEKAPSHEGVLSRAARSVISHLPDAALDLTGRLLYKHFG